MNNPYGIPDAEWKSAIDHCAETANRLGPLTITVNGADAMDIAEGVLLKKCKGDSGATAMCMAVLALNCKRHGIKDGCDMTVRDLEKSGVKLPSYFARLLEHIGTELFRDQEHGVAE